ncbi:MAG TPA: hypothetical protein V6D18_06080 [Thermosynechococcaceae cyanobacterium]
MVDWGDRISVRLLHCTCPEQMTPTFQPASSPALNPCPPRPDR